MEQVFNECSLSGAHRDKYVAIVAMNHICQASAALVSFGFSRSIKTTEDFCTRELASGYTFHSWLADNDVPREERTFMRSRCTQNPYVEELCQAQGMTELEEYVWHEKPCIGLALAHLWGIPCLSLDGDVQFSAPHASITHRILQDDATFEDKSYHVLLIKNKNDVDNNEQIIRDSLFPTLQSGTDILANAAHALPYLEFCGNARSQLYNLTASDIHFSIILNIFRVLNDTMRKVVEGAQVFSPQGIDFVPRESMTTAQKPTARKARVYMCSDGKSRYFEAHIRINKAKRVHIYADNQQKKVHIGHVGEHLPTAKFG